MRNGLIVTGKRVWARRIRRELRRCLKCQVIGANHFMAGCSSQNVCGSCGKEHRTAECTEGNHGSFYCTNCKTTDHALWDCMCPKFVEACKRLEDRDPERSYKFFPTNEPWMWEQEGEYTKVDWWGRRHRHGRCG